VGQSRHVDGSEIGDVLDIGEELVNGPGHLQEAPDGFVVKHNYTVVEEYEDPNGKFGNTLGNVALIDCKYVGELIPIKQLSEQLKRSMPGSTSWEDGFGLPDLDFCNYA